MSNQSIEHVIRKERDSSFLDNMEKRYDANQKSKSSLNNSVVHHSEKAEDFKFDEKSVYGPKGRRKKNPLASVLQSTVSA